MPCNPADNNLFPPIFPPPIGDLGIPISPIQVPFPDVSIPNDILQTLRDLLNQLQAVFPSGIFTGASDNFMKDILDVIASVLSQIAPFLSFYNFILALLNLIGCIIDVLCAIPDPFAISSAMERLFSQCLPPFLNLFPFLALIAMIIALLLLLLALIQYIIATIIAIIQEIIRNILLLANGASLQNADATVAAIQKLAHLFCIIENILSIFLVVSAIIAIVQSLAAAAGFLICDEGGDSGCCNETVCPDFIGETGREGILVTSGTLTYHSEISLDLSGLGGGIGSILGQQVASLRPERWQVVNNAPALAQLYSIDNIIKTIAYFRNPGVLSSLVIKDGFWPEGLTFDNETPPSNSPYTVDLKMNLDPNVFVNYDGYGARDIEIRDCVVTRKPYLGVLQHDNTNDLTNQTGTLQITGGLAYIDNGAVNSQGEPIFDALKVNGEQLTLDTLIHIDATSSLTLPASDDSLEFPVEFTWKPQHETLMRYSLITAGCLPGVKVEKAVLNQGLLAEGIEAVNNKLPPAPSGSRTGLAPNGVLPNIDGTLQCLTQAVTSFRQAVSIENAAVFQANATNCLLDLQDQTTAVICAATSAAVSQYQSTFTLDTNLQFVSSPILISVFLRDVNGVSLAQNLPPECQDQIADLIEGNATFGTVSDFTYDGYGSFTALLTADSPGDGQLTVSFDSKIFSIITPGDIAVTTTITEQTAAYEFVDGGIEEAVRRDASDVAASGGSGS